MAIHILLLDLIKINKPAVVKYQTPFLLSESNYSNSSLWIPLGIYSHTVNWAIIDNGVYTDSQNTKFFKG
jgi:hypothetical protein